ncbi:Ribonuclease H [Colletotrichum chlorophyti]|uniref:ribonuclease H n=1 Tax=Colletotrichum chlorophyti TaxID=708187 RepID=A0A1Q8S1I6_9PEZI|nr:Ribonuclease H [Colletotrichum chlorophyti]
MPAKKRGAPASDGPSTAKQKRKKGDPWFYGIRGGEKPQISGVYEVPWAECERKIMGVPNALVSPGFFGQGAMANVVIALIAKGFPSREEAQKWVNGIETGPPKIYAVARGNFTGIFDDYEKVKPAVTGAKGPKQKRCYSYEEAIAFIEEFGDEKTISKIRKEYCNGPDKAEDEQEVENDDNDEEVLQVKEEDEEEILEVTDEDEGEVEDLFSLQEVTKIESDAAPIELQPGLSPVFINAHINQPAEVDAYTDGSSLGNGKDGSRAGVGVFFGRNDPRNISEPLQGETQTNQRAELTAILRALQVMPLTQSMQIITDSMYSIKCVTQWYKTWEKKGWRTATGEVVKNKDLISGVRECIKNRDAQGARTRFTWVKGHAKNPGNLAADRLAVAGSKKHLTGRARRKLK